VSVGSVSRALVTSRTHPACGRSGCEKPRIPAGLLGAPGELKPPSTPRYRPGGLFGRRVRADARRLVGGGGHHAPRRRVHRCREPGMGEAARAVAHRQVRGADTDGKTASRTAQVGHPSPIESRPSRGGWAPRGHGRSIPLARPVPCGARRTRANGQGAGGPWRPTSSTWCANSKTCASRLRPSRHLRALRSRVARITHELDSSLAGSRHPELPLSFR
jgi:hypothetical protein